MPNLTQQENQEAHTLKGKEEKENAPNATRKPSRLKKPIKPTGFKEFEALTKEIVEASDGYYYERLHKQHQEIILNFNVLNR